MNTATFCISKEQSRRLNILKMLMACLVVLGHSVMWDYGMDGVVVVLQDPQWLIIMKRVITENVCTSILIGFEVIASMLLYRKAFTWKDNLIKKAKSLLIPYFLLNTIVIAIYASFQNIPFTQGFFGNPDNIVANWTLTQWLGAYGIGSRYPILIPMWFLRNLFVLNVLATVVKKLIDKFPIPMLILLVANALFNPFNFWYVLNPDDLLYWSLGYYIVKYALNIDAFDKKLWAPICYAIYLAISVYLHLPGKTLPRPIFNALNIVGLSLAIVTFYGWFTYNYEGKLQKLCEKYSRWSFDVYLFHGLPIYFAQKVCLRLFPQTTLVSLLQYLLLPLVIIIISILFGYYLNKWFPRVHAVLTGGRINK